MVWTFIKQMNIIDINHDLKAVIKFDVDNMQNYKYVKGMKGDRLVG